MKSIRTLAILSYWLIPAVLGEDYLAMLEPQDMFEEKFNAAKALWQSIDIQDYQYNFTDYGDGVTEHTLYPFVSQVRKGAGVSLVDAENQPILWTKKQTLDRYFDLIQNQLDQGATKLNVTYNQAQGYPERIQINTNEGTTIHVEIHAVIEFPQMAAIQAELDASFAKWESQGIEDYDFEFTLHGSSHIENGTVVSSELQSGGELEVEWTQEQTMDTYFALIQSQLDQGAKVIDVSYDPIKGFPEHIRIVTVEDKTIRVDISDFSVSTDHSSQRRRLLPNAAALQAQLDAARSKWQSQGILNYDYKFTNFGSNIPEGVVYPFASQVRNGAGISLVDGTNKEIVWTKKQTLDSYFGLIQHQLGAGARQMDVSYDSKRGFPNRIYVVMASGQIFHVEIFSFTYYQRRSLRGSNK
ncbi:expressed unknown protein [Seminavis robusta]|uniref:Uncharacterized protein n=1 Tax=Seminavis robusta TaxID=568900 RepID=A0A9N8DH03_9STRA|nr:expressed unknown protein [Seminavis robusta]|eukprot:Sro116_g056980.1 n/a (412) ;mRNA; r:23496-24731